MKIAIVTCDGFNEMDSFMALTLLNRVKRPGWRAELACPSMHALSMNGVKITAQRPLMFASEADAVLFGSGVQTREHVKNDSIMSAFHLDPEYQLIGSQCSGALFLHSLGLLKDTPVCTDATTGPVLQSLGAQVVEGPFHAKGNIATAGGCLSATYLAMWVIWRSLGEEAARDAIAYAAPVGQKELYVDMATQAIAAFI
ncbi:DJ-1/PfpI family protein [Hahella sp. CR1]|uniref:DJ-1/PfpI family protein n=1 Tax=Hahella sp. CR1 TaxID=2992807 RepID=UPI0024430F2C|nr:DJ-1/PfpI family protein [Hahella sp. CR1]MDG9671346.1 DJ-1/PfpI family protein [Hahella sp. CR1]